MKILTLILSILGLISTASAQTSGVISYPVNGELMGGTYASQGTASTMTGGAVIPTFVTTTATTTNGLSTIMVTSSSGIVNGEEAILVTGSGLQPGSVVSSTAGVAITLSLPATATGTVTVTFASVYLNFDGSPGCGAYCSLSIAGAGTASASYYAPINAGLGEWPATSHTISLTVVDSAGYTSTTANTNVTVFNSSPAGNCSMTLISGSIYCMGAGENPTVGPTASVTLTGTFQAGDILHASQFLLRPASPYTTAISGTLNATQTNITIIAPPIITGTATTSGSSTTATLDATSYNGVCVTRLGQIIAGTGFSPGTAIIKCLGSNQVLLSQAATASSASISIQYTFPTATGIAVASVGSSGGSGYSLSDILTVTQAGGSGGQLRVTSIGTGGSVTGVVPIPTTPANFYTANGYSNAMNLSTTGGGGTSATVNITAGFLATITDQGSGPGYEQWCVTAMSGAGNVNWTVVRGCNGTQPIAHPVGGTVGAFDPGPYPLLPSYITDSAGNTWYLVTHAETGFSDQNTVDTGVYYTTFTSGTAATAASMGDTITFTHPFAQLGQLDLNVIWYRGLGTLGNTNNAQSTMGYASPKNQTGYPFNSSMALNRVVPTTVGNSWPVSAGDLCIVTAAGSPFMILGSSTGPTPNPLLYPLGGSGMVSATGNTLTLLSGTSFSTAYSGTVSSAWQPGSPMVLGGSTTVHISSVVDGSHITTIETLTTSGSETYLVSALGSAVNPTSGWKLRERDPSRMFDLDAVATSSSCNGGALITNVDGMDTVGVAFHPASATAPTAVYGQSALIASTGSLSNSSVPALNTSTGTGGVDFEIDNLSMVHNATFLSLSNLGFNFLLVQLGGGVYEIGGGNANLSGGSCQGNPYGFIISNVASVGGSHPVYGRYQVNFGTKTDWFELWDGTGARIYAAYCNWNTVSGSLSNGVSIGGLTSPDTLQLGFLWQHSNILPMNSKMPTFAHTGSPNCIYDWHFDTSTGNTADSCGGVGYTLTATGIVTYPNTPSAVQSLIKAIPVQYGTASTSISGWSTMNSAVGTQQMDCLARSFTQFNGSDALTCSWSQTQGPTISFSSATATQPTISGIVATNTSSNQDYILSLIVTDLESPPVSSSAGTIEMGAAPLDANGVVANITGRAGQYFGPLMSYGNIPWGEADTLQYYMIGAQQTYQGLNNQYQQWATYPAANGTVTYPFTAKGEGLGIAGTTTTGSIIATSTAIPIADSTKISSTFPTWIMLGIIGTSDSELIRICSETAGTPPAATLNVCYDGRGLSGNASADAQNNGTIGPAAGWPMGTTVGEMRIQGTSTLFASDSVRPIAQGGVPGPIGLTAQICMSGCPGTVTLAVNSTTMTGSGTGWTNAIVGYNIRIAATHAGGTAFIFWRQITGWTSGASVTLDHAAPSDIDGTAFSYQLLVPQYVSFELPAPQDGHTIRLLQPVFGCESETACFGVGGHDILQLDALTISGQKYSYQTAVGTAGSFGPNFYGTGLAARNFYLRSGYLPAYTLANYVDEYWLRGPEMGDGYAGGLGLNYAGGVIGAFADFLTNPSTALTSATFEAFGIGGYTFSYLLNVNTMAPLACNLDDTRDTGAGEGIIGLLANWDTNSGTGTLSGSIGSNSTGGTVTGWAGSMQTPPFVALITLAGSDATYEVVHVTGISGTTWTWTPAYYPSGTAAHTSGAQILSGAAMYTFLLSKLDVRDQGCRRNGSSSTPTGPYSGNEVNSWAHAANFTTSTATSANTHGPLTLTATQPTGTVTLGGTAPVCNGVDTGTLFINSGSPYTATLTGASTVGGPPIPSFQYERIYIWDGTNLAAFAYTASMYGSTSATVTLAGSGTAAGLTCTSSGSPCTYMTSNSGAFTVIWNSNNDSFTDNEALKKDWECITTGAGTFTLNRPWDGGTNNNFYSNTYTTDGFEQQPFMLGGYKVTGMRWAQHSSNPTVASDYTTMSQQAGTWYRNYGWDFTPGNSRGSYYTAISQICNPTTLVFNPALLSNVLVSTLHGGDGGGGNPGCGAVGSNIQNSIARVNSVEGGSGMTQYYNVNPSANKSTVDSFYGAMFGVGQAYGANAGCASSVTSTCDGVDAANCEVSGMNGYKWPGFCFGMGGFFSTSYPALRTLGQTGQSSYNPVPISGRAGSAGFGTAP